MDIYLLQTAVPDVLVFPLHIHKQNQPVGRNERLDQMARRFCTYLSCRSFGTSVCSRGRRRVGREVVWTKLEANHLNCCLNYRVFRVFMLLRGPAPLSWHKEELANIWLLSSQILPRKSDLVHCTGPDVIKMHLSPEPQARPSFMGRGGGGGTQGAFQWSPRAAFLTRGSFHNHSVTGCWPWERGRN